MCGIKAASCSVSIPESFLGSATGETWVGGSECHQGASIFLPKALQTTKAPAFLGDGFVFTILLPLVRLCRGGCHYCLELARPTTRHRIITYVPRALGVSSGFRVRTCIYMLRSISTINSSIIKHWYIKYTLTWYFWIRVQAGIQGLSAG